MPELEPEANVEVGVDNVSAALNAMVAVLQEVVGRAGGMITEADALVAARLEGRSWDEILLTEESRCVTALLAECAEAVGRANSEVRRAEAATLYASGLSMQRIGRLLGVSRQRVAILLRAVASLSGEHGDGEKD